MNQLILFRGIQGIGGAGMPCFAKALIAKQAAGPVSGRPASWAAIESQLALAESSAADAASAAAAQAARKGLIQARDSIVLGIKKSFSEAVVATWSLTIFIVLGTLVATLFIPSLRLRGKGEEGLQAAA